MSRPQQPVPALHESRCPRAIGGKIVDVDGEQQVVQRAGRGRNAGAKVPPHMGASQPLHNPRSSSESCTGAGCLLGEGAGSHSYFSIGPWVLCAVCHVCMRMQPAQMPLPARSGHSLSCMLCVCFLTCTMICSFDCLPEQCADQAALQRTVPVRCACFWAATRKKPHQLLQQDRQSRPGLRGLNSLGRLVWWARPLHTKRAPVHGSLACRSHATLCITRRAHAVRARPLMAAAAVSITPAAAACVLRQARTLVSHR